MSRESLLTPARIVISFRPVRGLDVALSIGLLVQCTKLGDMMLRPKQQKWVQDRCETLALKLSDVDIDAVHGRLQSPRGMVALQIGAWVAYFSAVAWQFWSDPEPDEMSGWTEFAYCVLVGVMAILPTRFAFRHVGAVLLGWILGEHNVLKTLVRVPLLVCGSLAFSACTAVAITWAERRVSPTTGVMIGLALFVSTIFLPGVLLFFVTSAAGLLLVVAKLSVAALSLVLGAMRGLVWRIVEHNKGAWAAITLLLTVALAVADIVVKAG